MRSSFDSRGPHDEGKVDVLAFDFGIAPHVATQSGMFGERSRLRRRHNRQAIGRSLPRNYAADIACLPANGFDRVGIWLDPVNERREMAMGPALRGQRARPFFSNILHLKSSFPGPPPPQWRPHNATLIVLPHCARVPDKIKE